MSKRQVQKRLTYTLMPLYNYNKKIIILGYIFIRIKNQFTCLFSELHLVRVAPQDIKNYYKSIAEHKDVSKIVLMLSSAVNSFRENIMNALQGYSDYQFLWEEDRDEVVKVSDHYMDYKFDKHFSEHAEQYFLVSMIN